MVRYDELTNNGIAMVDRVLEDVDEKVFDDKSIKYYSLSDVFGPVKITD
jgi:hypothetical protein